MLIKVGMSTWARWMSSTSTSTPTKVNDIINQSGCCETCHCGLATSYGLSGRSLWAKLAYAYAHMQYEMVCWQAGTLLAMDIPPPGCKKKTCNSAIYIRLPWCMMEIFLLNHELHPGKLTWNPKMEVWKMIVLFKHVIFRFHVSFRGCKDPVVF